MTGKKSRIAGATILLIIVCTPLVGQALPQAPKSFAVVRNDSTSPVTFEYKTADGWLKITVGAQKDVNITGDRIRIGTDREDKATITVELPVESGKKYIVFWNDPPGMWDFKGTS